MMPADGAPARAQQLGTLARLTHERATARGDRRVARGDRARRGRAARARSTATSCASRGATGSVRGASRRSSPPNGRSASADGQERWREARASDDDFAAFAPALERNVELARAYGEYVAEDGESRYEGLLGDYDFGLRTEELRRVFGALAEQLPPLAAQARLRSPRRELQVPVDAQQAAVAGTLRRLGVDRASWRVDVSAHPFTAWVGRDDSRLTTRYGDGDVESLLSSLHEYGHALYERQIDPALDRTNLGAGTSMSVHESQSKLWENHVARNPAFAEVLAAELRAGGFAVQPAELHAALTGVEASAVRVSADPLTYPLHIVVRFELELALIDGELAVADVPARGTSRCAACSAWRCPPTRSAACRTCTGAPAPSATSRATRSAA